MGYSGKLKKWVFGVTVVLMASTLVACGSAQPTAAPTTTASGATTAAPAPQTFDKVRFAGGYMGGTIYSVAMGMMQVAKKAWGDKVQLSIEETGGGVDNIVRTSMGTDQMCESNNLELLDCNNRQGSYKASKYDLAVTMVMPYESDVFWFTTMANKGWTARDLQGKTISNNTEGGMAYRLCKQILDFLGIKVTERNMTQADAATAMIEGTIVAHGTLVYAAPWDEVAARKGIWLVPPHPDDIPKIMEKFPYFAKTTFYGSKYFKTQGGGNDILTVGLKQGWVVQANMPDDMVYNLIKTAYESTTALAAAYKPMEALSAKDILTWPLKGSIHPGAAKYYQEKGITIPEDMIYKKK